MRELQLPKWAELKGPGVVEVYADGFYPEWLGLFENFEGDRGELPQYGGEMDQYWLECAFQCMKMDIQFAIAGTAAMPPVGGALTIIVKDASKVDGKWAQKNYPEGRGAVKATQGKEARSYYKLIRQVPTV